MGVTCLVLLIDSLNFTLMLSNEGKQDIMIHTHHVRFNPNTIVLVPRVSPIMEFHEASFFFSCGLSVSRYSLKGLLISGVGFPSPGMFTSADPRAFTQLTNIQGSESYALKQVFIFFCGSGYAVCLLCSSLKKLYLMIIIINGMNVHVWCGLSQL